MAGIANPFGPNTADNFVPGWNPAQWQDWYLNNTPEAGWVQYLQNQGLFGIDPASQYAARQYGKTYGGYTAQAAQNPNLGFMDYLNQSNLDLKHEFMDQSPQTRGDFSDRTFAPRARFMRAY
jgi:hypothetical protein